MGVNRTWEWFLGQGLVNPVDQMHSSNPPSVPGVLEFLADDFVARGYDLRHLVRSIARTQVYRLSSRHTGAAPPAEALAPARLKPLSPRQWAVSFELVTGPPTLMRDDDAKARGEKYRELEKRGAELLKSLDPTLEGYQASVLEALFLSNHAGVWKRFEPASRTRSRIFPSPSSRNLFLCDDPLGHAFPLSVAP